MKLIKRIIDKLDNEIIEISIYKEVNLYIRIDRDEKGETLTDPEYHSNQFPNNLVSRFL